MSLARTAGPYYGSIDGASLQTAVNIIAGPSGSEIILLHGDKRRLRLMVNLIAQLNAWRIDHILVLGFTSETCDTLRAGKRIGCATSTYREDSDLEHKFVAWLQRFHLIKRLIAMNTPSRPLNVLALDTDMAVRASPYGSLHTIFKPFTMVTTFDYKGGFANTNIGYIYIQNASPTGALHGLFEEFERRVDHALKLRAKLTGGERARHTTKFLWDQNLWNKVLLSDMASHAVYLPDGSDLTWTSEHKKILRARRYWREESLQTPSSLSKIPPWGQTTERALWYELRGHRNSSNTDASQIVKSVLDVNAYVDGASGSGCSGTGGGCGGGGSGEKIALAPAWLVAMENGLGLKGKHWLYGALQPPAELVHYTCTTQTEAARIWPLRLFGHWHKQAVDAEVQPTATTTKLLAVEGATLGSPLPPTSWARLNMVHAILGALGGLSGRLPVAPSTNCTGAGGGPVISPRRQKKGRGRRNAAAASVDGQQVSSEEKPLSSRCFWHVHHKRHGVRCVLRIGHCDELATPTEGDEAEVAAAASGTPPPVVTLDLAAGGSSVVDALKSHDASKLVLLRIVLPSEATHPGGPGMAVLGGRKAGWLEKVEPRLRQAIKAFKRQCHDLVSGPACNNICS